MPVSKRRHRLPLRAWIEAWYRSLLFVREPGFMEEWDQDTEEPSYTIDEIRRRLRLDAREP